MNDNSRMPDGRPIEGEAQQPRGGQHVMGPTESLSEQTLAVDLARVDLDQAIATAHRFPRNLDVIVRKIEQMALYDESAAERCIYMLPRAGKAIVGPSIGFANILATAWGNCRDGGRWVRTDRHEKVVVCEGAFFDLETNRQTIAPAIRRIVGSGGQLYSPDMITVTAQAGASVARRNAIINGVPRPLWHPTYEKALVVVRGTEATLGERRAKMVAAFAGFGIEAKRVFAALGVRDEKEITLDHIVMLRGMFEALKDGSATPEEMFDPRRMVGADFDKVENPMADEHDETAGMGDRPQPAAPRPAQTAPAPQPATQPAAAAPGPQQQATTPDPAPATTAGAPAAPAADKPKSKAGRPSKAELARRAAAAAGEPAQSDAQPSETDAQAQNPPPAQQQPQPVQQTAPAAQQPKPADPPPAAAKPRNTAEYEPHLLAWLAACTSPSQVEDHWRNKDERDLRGICRIIEDDFERMKRHKDTRIAELKKA